MYHIITEPEKRIKSMRQKIEFYCEMCDKYFDVNLNTSLNGNHRIHCPNCAHIHYRKIEKGEITDFRFSDNQDDPIVDDLRPMKASCRDYTGEKAEDYLPNLKGFMSRLWKERFSSRV